MPTLLPRPPRLALLIAVTFVSGTFAACQRKQAEVQKTPPLTIPVSTPVEREVTDFAEYTGRTDAVESVSVRARVTGELKSMPFGEGTEVRGPVKFAWLKMSAGDLLFKIDPEPYQAIVDQAEGQLLQCKGQRAQAQLTYESDKQLFESGSGSGMTVALDKAILDAADGKLRSAEGALKAAKYNLSLTEIHAPVSGRISRYFYTPGNQVSENQTLLTTIVSMERMYAYFDVEERTYQRLLDGAKGGLPGFAVRMTIEGDTKPETRPEGKGDSKGGSGKGAARGDAKPEPKSDPNVFVGKLNFINNQVNPSTGTVAVRAVFENRRTYGGMWKLLPGMFVRVRIDLGEPYRSALVSDKAIGSDQGLKYVYVVDAENKVQYRRVDIGPLQEDGLRVIRPYKPGRSPTDLPTGVKADERVVVGGLPQLRPKMEVKPDLTPMPTATSGPDTNRGKKP
ncbi:efflux RND transporter periplasmic adaptor subunit [Frigoriglobus tundricola]|uniref:RND efflux pump membrane fusion protein barrel-sandwich domain-containing protein n=1 Tax=Frigoriglobus tundricola TaxID=2774151 RepID=A0A6M5Z1D0_9BACT|nr:efflux RND transporter periplasmic adaptor subunit [Frigoriglobus tundricola]QJW99556.1 hypothetical protein FTUN_7168 [Frigoriglobus tundricola]